MAKNSVLLFCNSYNTLLLHRRNLIEHFLDLNYQVILLAPYQQDVDIKLSQCFSIAQQQKILTRFVSFDPNKMNLFSDILLFFKLLYYFWRYSPKLIMSFTTKANLFAGLANAVCCKKLIAVICGFGSHFISGGRSRRLLAMSYRLARYGAAAFVVLNSRDLRYLRFNHIIPANKLYLIPGEGVNTDYYHAAPIMEDTKKILYIGRILTHKGINELIAAMSKLREQYPGITLQILGDNNSLNLSAINRDKFSQLVSAGTFEYLGFTNDVRPYISLASCVVLPSYGEGLSRALLEAASMQRPIIASDIPGCKEIVVDNVTGWLCRPRDVDSLYNKLRQFAETDATALNAMGIEARAHVVANFSDKIILAKYQQLFHSLCVE